MQSMLKILPHIWHMECTEPYSHLALTLTWERAQAQDALPTPYQLLIPQAQARAKQVPATKRIQDKTSQTMRYMHAF